MRPRNRNRNRQRSTESTLSVSGPAGVTITNNDTSNWVYSNPDPRYFTQPDILVRDRSSFGRRRMGCFKVSSEYLCMLWGINPRYVKQIIPDPSTGVIKIYHDDEDLPGVYDLAEGGSVPESGITPQQMTENIANYLREQGYIIESPYDEEEVDDAASDSGEA